MSNVELIKEARWAIDQFDGEDVEVSASWLGKLADALEAAEEERDDAWEEGFDRAISLSPRMTAATAGASERERLANRLDMELGSFLAHSPSAPARFWGQAADAILAAGFGDVAAAKAAAWDEGWAAEVIRNPYRTPNANGGDS